MSKTKSKQKILIVDDMPINITALWEMLKFEYNISVCTSGEESLEIAISPDPPDLILLDIMMPGMDGYEVCRRLKKNSLTRKIPVIFISAKSSEEDETKGLELGAVDYVAKPFRPAIVKARIKTHLELKNYRDYLEHSVLQRTNELTRVNEQLRKDIAERKKAQQELKQAREEESKLIEMTTELLFELNLSNLLGKIMDATKELLSADRCTLFMVDERTNELWSRVAQGLETRDIRFPSDRGIAGTVYTSGETINIQDAYSDARFNPDIDRSTGYQTRSILCMPVRNKKGLIIGVIQVLNKEGGPFTQRDEQRLQAFSAQASMALENAKLFEYILNMKNYNESLLESMSNGLISLDADGFMVKCNSTAFELLNETEGTLIGRSAVEYFSRNNHWVVRSIEKVMESGDVDHNMDTDLLLADGAEVSINLSVVPLLGTDGDHLGTLLIMEDITGEKRLKSTISRYMTKQVADQLLESGETVLGGRIQEATVLFSDIRQFTSIAEKIGPQETVALLNEYFTICVDIVFQHEGILDKFIGDAILSVFGAPFSTGEDPDRAVQTAIEIMIALREYNQRRIADAKDPIEIGIGISTNEVLSGNVGSLKRMDYTVIGDGVNLAARLESANKIYGSNILISEFTYRGVKNGYQCREVDQIIVKGKSKPVAVYQVLDYHDRKFLTRLEDVIDLFNRGVENYRRRDFKNGLADFEKALSLYPGDSVSRIYRDRCRLYIDQPPADDWTFVIDLQFK